MRLDICHRAPPLAGLVIALVLSSTTEAQERKVIRYAIGSKPLISMTNNYGAITVRASGSNQIVVSTTASSDRSIFEAEQNGNRIEIRSESKTHDTIPAECILLVPTDSTVSLHLADGSLHVEGLRGDVNVETATARVEAEGITGAHVHIKTLSGSVTLTDIRESRVDIHSVSGSIKMHNVREAIIAVGSGSGRITYEGDPGISGEYKLTSHNGEIDVSIPASAMVEINAHSSVGGRDGVAGAEKLGTRQDNQFLKAGGPQNGSRFVLRSFRGKIRLDRP